LKQEILKQVQHDGVRVQHNSVHANVLSAILYFHHGNWAFVCSFEPYTRIIPLHVRIKAGRPLDHPVKPDDDTADRMMTQQTEW
jgi:hypothetical protein